MTISYDRLWKLMIDKKINKTQLCEKAGITTNAMAKLGKEEMVQLEILIKICKVLNCKIDDIIEYWLGGKINGKKRERNYIRTSTMEL